MDSIRSNNMRVDHMKEEIIKSLSVINKKTLNNRVIRQLLDGERFFEMISQVPYNECKTVGELKNAIMQERNKLKVKLEDLDEYAPAYQMTIFGTFAPVTSEKSKRIEQKRSKLSEQIHWLHKCLGICSNRRYFN